MKTNISLEQALSKARPGLKAKMGDAILSQSVRAEPNDGTLQDIGGNSPFCGGPGKGLTEDEICEYIFQWWISGKAYKTWFAETFAPRLFSDEDFAD